MPLKTQHLFTAHTSCVPVSSPPSDLFLPPVVEPRRSRAAMSGEVLHVIQRNPLRQQVGVPVATEKKQRSSSGMLSKTTIRYPVSS